MLTLWPIVYCCRLQALPGQQLLTISSCCRRPPVPDSTCALTMLGAPQWCRPGHSSLPRLPGPLVSGGLACCGVTGLQTYQNSWLLTLSLTLLPWAARVAAAFPTCIARLWCQMGLPAVGCMCSQQHGGRALQQNSAALASLIRPHGCCSNFTLALFDRTTGRQ